MSNPRVAVLVLTALTALAGCVERRGGDGAQGDETRGLEQLATLPVQDGGRVKPLSSFASFLLLQINARRSIRTEDGRTLSPMEWLVDAWTDPAKARDYRCIEVANSDVLDAIGLSDIIRKKRDRYSYSELIPGAHRLQQLASRFGQLESNQRSLVQRQTLDVYHAMSACNAMFGFLDFARHRFAVEIELALAHLDDIALDADHALDQIARR